MKVATPLALPQAICRAVMASNSPLTKAEIEALVVDMGVPVERLSQALHALRESEALQRVDEGEGRRYCYAPGDPHELRRHAGENPSAEEPLAGQPKRRAAKGARRAAPGKVSRKQRTRRLPPKDDAAPAAPKFVYAITDHGDVQIALPDGRGEPVLMQCADAVRLARFIEAAWPIIAKAHPELAKGPTPLRANGNVTPLRHVA
jgi:hypothetical protein